MEDLSKINIDEYKYNLPNDRIARYPLPERDKSKLLIYNKGTISEDIFFNIYNYFNSRDLLIFNNAKVIQARIFFERPTGSIIEVLCLEPYLPAEYSEVFQTTTHCSWICMIGNLKKWKESKLQKKITINNDNIELFASKQINENGKLVITFEWNNNNYTFGQLLDYLGHIPIPPYLNRPSENIDKERYQTVYSQANGSVAAPTAGLHFTSQLLHNLSINGVKNQHVTLHVGAGTFKPIKANNLAEHQMHTEVFEISTEILDYIIEYQGNITAIGTTSVRTLETLYWLGIKLLQNPNIMVNNLTLEQWDCYNLPSYITVNQSINALKNYLDTNKITRFISKTQILIIPGYKFKIVNKLVTNFHQPGSTLLLLIAAFVGGNWKDVYEYASKNSFRFLSYGDSSFLIP